MGTIQRTRKLASMVRRQAAIRANQRREVTVVKSIFAPSPPSHTENQIAKSGVSELVKKEGRREE